jgi:hypothetical protein
MFAPLGFFSLTEYLVSYTAYWGDPGLGSKLILQLRTEWDCPELSTDQHMGRDTNVLTGVCKRDS